MWSNISSRCESRSETFSEPHTFVVTGDTLTSSSRLWTKFQCKDVALTLQHLARSEPVPVNVIAGPRSDVKAVIALRSATDRFRSLSLQLRPSDLSHVFRELTTPAPALEHLEISAIHNSGAFNPSIPTTFLGGSTPSLKSLRLNEINAQLKFSEFPALTHLTLITNARVFDISELLFQVLTSAKLLGEVSVTFSSPTTPIPGSQAAVQLPRMRKSSFSNIFGEFPGRLLSLLDMPSLEEIKLCINLPREDTDHARFLTTSTPELPSPFERRQLGTGRSGRML